MKSKLLLLYALTKLQQLLNHKDKIRHNLNMPLSVLRPVLTDAHKAKLTALGFNNENMAIDGEVAFLLTTDGDGKGKRAWTLGAPAWLIQMKHAFGHGTIYTTVDDLLSALEADTPKA